MHLKTNNISAKLTTTVKIDYYNANKCQNRDVVGLVTLHMRWAE